MTPSRLLFSLLMFWRTFSRLCVTLCQWDGRRVVGRVGVSTAATSLMRRARCWSKYVDAEGAPLIVAMMQLLASKRCLYSGAQ